MFQPFIPVAGVRRSRARLDVCVQLMTTFPATIIVTLTKAEPLTFIRLSGMFVAVAGTAAGAAARAIHPTLYCSPLSLLTQVLL